MTEFDNKGKVKADAEKGLKAVEDMLSDTPDTPQAKAGEDPVDKTAQEVKAEEIDKEMDEMAVSISDLKEVPQSAAKVIHPFDNYQLAPKLILSDDKHDKKLNPKGTDTKISKTYIVVLAPTINVNQDRSNLGRTIKTKQRGKLVDKVVDIPTSHNRMLPDYDQGGVNTDIVFDRLIITSEGHKLWCAVVRSHSLRAQLMFKLDQKTSKIAVRKMYQLFDMNQKGPLRRLFLMLKGKELKMIQQSNLISAKDDE